MKVAVLNDYQQAARAFADWSEVERIASVTIFNTAFASLDDAARALGPFDILCVMRERQPFQRALLSQLPNLKCIVSTGRGNRSIDMAAAAEQGIVVCGTEMGPSREATAELTLALMLAVARPILDEDRAIREGGWQIGVGTLLSGKTLGLIGLGEIGRIVARYAQALGMRVIAWSQNLTEESARSCAVERVEKAELFRQSDFVSVQVLLSERTLGLIGAAELDLMKPGAALINTARGPIIVEDALIDALQSRRIVAALDVFDQEPLPADHPLRRMPNAILTPHIGYVSRETYAIYFRGSVEAVLAFCRGAPIRVLNAAPSA